MRQMIQLEQHLKITKPNIIRLHLKNDPNIDHQYTSFEWAFNPDGDLSTDYDDFRCNQ